MRHAILTRTAGCTVGVSEVIIWLNGAFGAGKSSTAEQVAALLPGAAGFDPELVGVMLSAALPAPTGDFQDLPLWRTIVVETAAGLVEHGAAPLTVPMTLLRRDYAAEVIGGLRGRGVPVLHVLLHVPGARLRRRIVAADPDVEPSVRDTRRDWRLRHVEAYERALPWLRDAADLVVNTAALTPRQAALQVVGRVRAARAGRSTVS